MNTEKTCVNFPLQSQPLSRLILKFFFFLSYYVVCNYLHKKYVVNTLRWCTICLVLSDTSGHESSIDISPSSHQVL